MSSLLPRAPYSKWCPPTYPHRWLPLSSRQPRPGLSTKEEPQRQCVWDSEMTPLSLLLSHCYCNWDDGKAKPAEGGSLRPKGPPYTATPRAPPECRYPQPKHLSQCSWMVATWCIFIFATKKTKRTKTVFKPQNTWKSTTPTRVSLSQEKSPETLY